MALTPGTRLGPYEVTAQIGVGGMGEVYRATDTNLKRHVAIKVLPEALATDPERLARFQREAEVLASLSHSNIAAIYGIERSGGAPALVMELVEGPTLADRVALGAIPLEETIRITKQIVEALAAAHGHGVIHRDLKPANIKVRPDGTVKVLDFGLAKAVHASREGGGTGATHAPTLTGAVSMTGVGIVLGTAAYMSPEQAMGQPVDERTDIWALGCTMYEMLSGRSAFPGDSAPRVLAKVLESEPDFSALPATTTPIIRRLIRRCLEKDPRRRLHHVADVGLDLDDSLESAAHETSASGVARPPRRVAMWVLGALAIGALGTVAVSTLLRSALREATPIVRSTLSTVSASGSDVSLQGLAISPDGQRVLYQAAGLLHVRSVDQLESLPLLDTKGAIWPAFSPDGQSIAFFVPAETAIKRMSFAGGSATTITTTDGGSPRGLSWGSDDAIVFATATSGGLWRVRAVGGKAERLTTVVPAEAFAHHWPSVLPNGRGVLFAANRGSATRIAVVSLDTRAVTYLVPSGNRPRYASSGHLVYEAERRLWAVGFDVERLAVTSDNAVPVVENVMAEHVDLALNGSLVYVSGNLTDLRRTTLTWVDRDGREEPLTLPSRTYGTVRVSPDGRRIATDIRDPIQPTEIWVSDVSRPAWTKLATPDQDGGDFYPRWTPDGRRVVFSMFGNAAPSLFWTLADGTGKPEALLTIPDNLFIDARAWTPDGTSLLFTYGNPTEPKTGSLPMAPPDSGAQRFQALIDRGGNALAAAISPDGRWVVTESPDSGAYGIYIERFPEFGDRQRVSGESGGQNAVWSHDGRELYYRRRDDGAMMAVPIRTAPALSIGTPTVLFESKGDTLIPSRSWDVAPDGRFLMLKAATSSTATPSRDVVLVQNWFEELKRLVPGN